MEYVLALRYYLSFAFFSEKIRSALRDFCTVRSPSTITSTHSSIAGDVNKSILSNLLTAMNESAMEPVDWLIMKERPLFVHNIEELIREFQRDLQAKKIIKRFRHFQHWLVFLFFVGLFSGVAEIVILKSVGTYLIGNIVWMLCCLSLYVTIKLVIRDWKKELYVSGQESR